MGFPDGSTGALGGTEGGCRRPRAPLPAEPRLPLRQPETAPPDPQRRETLRLRPLPAPIR